MNKITPLGWPASPNLAAEVEKHYGTSSVVEIDFARKSELARANLCVRGYIRPTKVDVIESLDAVESMALSFIEQGGHFGDIESAFERVRMALETRPAPTHASAKREAADAWRKFRDGED